MIDRKELKTLSKEQLRGQWATVVLITLGIGVIIFIFNRLVNIYYVNGEINIILGLSQYLVSISVSIITYNLYLRLTRGVKVKVSDMFVSGRTYIKAIGVSLLQLLMCIPLAIIIVMIDIAIIVGIFSTTGIYDNMTITGDIHYLLSSNSVIELINFFWLILIISLVVCIPLMILGIYLYPSIILMCEDDSRGLGECIGISFKLMNGNVWKYIILQLSYLGWGLLGILTLGIGYLWLIPYIKTVNMNFFNNLTGYENKINTDSHVE